MIIKERLDKILVKKGIAENTTKAKALIMSGKVIVNEKKLEKSGTKLPLSVKIRILAKDHDWVSRGGVKLSYLIKKYNINVENKICADIGASTGGFTDVLIKNKAKKVYSIDVGKGQLNWKLVTNNKVDVLDKTNIRNLDLEDIDKKINLITCDVSFISIRKALERIVVYSKNKIILILLVKPQFELSKDKIGKNGIVTENKFREEAKSLVEDWLTNNSWHIKGTCESPITGQKGNKEYFIYSIKRLS